MFLVQIETDAGITGIGEGFALGSLESLATLTMETLKPVSYTHLDVYKRQMLKWC